MAVLTQRPGAYLNVSIDATGKTNYSGQRIVDVSAATSESDAIAALAGYGFAFGAAYNTDNAAATLSGRNTTYNTVAGLWTFTLAYGIPNSSGGATGDGTVTSIKYDFYTYSEYMDHDLDGNPYCNSAGTPFDPPLEVEKTGCIVTVKKYRTTFPLSTIFSSGNAVNSSVIALPDGNSIPAGKAKLVGIFMPEQFIGATSAPAATEIKFDIRKDGWAKNVVDQGAQGWASDDGGTKFRGILTTAGAGSPPAGMVRLDGTGVPVKPDVFSQVSDAEGNKFDVEGPDDPQIPASLVNGDLSNENITVLQFKRNDEVDFTGIF